MKSMPLLMLLLAGSALADDAAMLRCRAIPEVAPRVACYDAIPLAAGGPATAAAPAGAAARPAAVASPAGAAPAAAMPGSVAGPAPALAGAAPAAGGAATAVGAATAGGAAEPAWAALPSKPAAKAAEPAKDADSLETSIEGSFLGWVPGQRIRLANGQIWRIEDGSTEDTDLKNPKAKLRKGMLGAVYLDIEGAYRAPRVKRVQ